MPVFWNSFRYYFCPQLWVYKGYQQCRLCVSLELSKTSDTAEPWQHGFELQVQLYRDFSLNGYYSTTWSIVESTDAKPCMQRSALLIPVLFKGQLYGSYRGPGKALGPVSMCVTAWYHRSALAVPLLSVGSAFKDIWGAWFRMCTVYIGQAAVRSNFKDAYYCALSVQVDLSATVLFVSLWLFFKGLFSLDLLKTKTSFLYF